MLIKMYNKILLTFKTIGVTYYNQPGHSRLTHLDNLYLHHRASGEEHKR